MFSTCIARIIARITMNALVTAPMKLDRSRPAALKDLPVTVWSKVFSMPIFSTSLFTALLTKTAMA